MKADVGIAHDGDADRIGVVDDQGNFVEYEVMLSLIAGYMLRKFGKGKIVTTVDAGFALDDYLRPPLGGEVIRTRVGDVAVATSSQNTAASSAASRVARG